MFDAWDLNYWFIFAATVVSNIVAKTTHICRHGFYYVVSLEDWHRRRRGKALRNSICIVQQSKIGIQGRLLPIQEHPFECQSNYAAVAALRCNFDMQDLRRVLPATFWLEGELPHIGDRPSWGYMNAFEWDGDEWVLRRYHSEESSPAEESIWVSNALSLQQWRNIVLTCSEKCTSGRRPLALSAEVAEMSAELIAAFSDGRNTGFYINSYTAKSLPPMDGVLDEMRRVLERIHIKSEDRSKDSSRDDGAAHPRPSKFAETLRVLKRLSASYRRCYWKSASEMLFPIFYGHMTFASHRCWTVFIKKGIFLAAEAWCKRFGRVVRHAALREGVAKSDSTTVLAWIRIR